MNKPNNLDSFNSASPLFSDLSDDQAAQVSGGFVSEIYLGNQQAQGLLGGDYDSNESYSLVVFDTNGDNRFADGDDYFIDSFSDAYLVDGSLSLTSAQAVQFGLSDGDPNLTTSLGLSANGTIVGIAQASPAIAPRSSGRR